MLLQISNTCSLILGCDLHYFCKGYNFFHSLPGSEIESSVTYIAICTVQQTYN